MPGGSGGLAQQTTSETQPAVAVLKVCPHCGTEYETAARFCPADGTAGGGKTSSNQASSLQLGLVNADVVSVDVQVDDVLVF